MLSIDDACCLRVKDRSLQFYNKHIKKKRQKSHKPEKPHSLLQYSTMQQRQKLIKHYRQNYNKKT